jgi:hypothetical protein
MKKLILLFTILICAVSLNAQTKDMRKGQYFASLCGVDAPNGIEIISLDTISSLYEDSLIKIRWTYGVSNMGFELFNKSNNTIKIIWDDAAFISINNESDKIFHSGIKYNDRENPQSATSVYKKTIISDLIAPTSYTKFISGQYGGWSSAPLIPYNINLWSLKKVEYLDYLIGKTMRIILPIKINDILIEYGFNFRTSFISAE